MLRTMARVGALDGAADPSLSGERPEQAIDRPEHRALIRADRTADFVIVGYSPPERARAGFGALPDEAMRRKMAAHLDSL